MGIYRPAFVHRRASQHNGGIYTWASIGLGHSTLASVPKTVEENMNRNKLVALGDAALGLG
jgi:hypothetical protein